MVTVWGVFQLLGVKVTVAGEALISPLKEAMVSVTFWVGAALSTTLMVPAPLSVTVKLQLDWVTVIPVPDAVGVGADNRAAVHGGHLRSVEGTSLA